MEGNNKTKMTKEDRIKELEDFIEEIVETTYYYGSPIWEKGMELLNKRKIPTHDPQTGELNPYYEELTGEKNPLSPTIENKYDSLPFCKQYMLLKDLEDIDYLKNNLMKGLRVPKTDKVDIYVRFPNSDFYNKTTIDPLKIEDPKIFNDEVFFTIDNVRVATRKEEWEKICNK